MGRKPVQYTVTSYVMFEDGRTLPFNNLKDNEKKEIFEVWKKRLSKSVSDYCQTHPGTFSTLPGKNIEEEG